MSFGGVAHAATVTLGPGTWVASTIGLNEINQSETIIGAGKGVTILVGPINIGGPINVGISDLTIQDNDIGLGNDGASVTLTNVDIRAVDAVQFDGGQLSISNAKLVGRGPGDPCCPFGNGTGVWDDNGGLGGGQLTLSQVSISGFSFGIRPQSTNPESFSNVTVGPGNTLADCSQPVGANAVVSNSTDTDGSCGFTAAVVGNTPPGTNVQVSPVDATTGGQPVTVSFANGTTPGTTTVVSSPTGPLPPTGFSIASAYYTVSTTAVFDTAVVCITDPSVWAGPPPPPVSVLLHYSNSLPPGVDVTASGYPIGTTICSIPLTSLSPFVIAVPAPVATAQTITFGPLAPMTLGDLPFSVSATATSGLTVSFAASGACTVNGNLVTITGAGSCTITASQAGNTNYSPAASVSQTFTVVVARPPFIIPAGSTASFTNAQFSACNSLSWGYQLNGDPNQIQATKPAVCSTAAAGLDVTIGPFATSRTLRVFLTDNSCFITYYSDGTPVDHVIVSGSNPYTLRFADAGYAPDGCLVKTTTDTNFTGFNFTVDLAIKQVTTLTVNNSTGDFNDSATLSGTLQDSNGIPIVGATVTFTVSGQSCSGVTGATGSASCAITPNEAAGSYTITGSYAGSASFLPASGTGTLVVTLEETTLMYTGPKNIPNGSPTTLSAVLLEDGVTPIAGRTVTLTLGSGATAQSCTGVTDAAGVASCTIASVNQPGGPGTATASFAGDAFYRPATDTKTILNFSFLATGSFVIGDNGTRSWSVNTVTFWGAQWAKDNSLSGGSAPHSFKGFAENPTPPSCGTAWSADPGNSTPPPDGPLPAYMAVIVTSSAAQSGSTISGNIVEIVIVKTNPGYAPNPGHAGTGTVVAVVVVC
jgi:hypothetical protein